VSALDTLRATIAVLGLCAQATPAYLHGGAVIRADFFEEATRVAVDLSRYGDRVCSNDIVEELRESPLWDAMESASADTGWGWVDHVFLSDAWERAGTCVLCSHDEPLYRLRSGVTFAPFVGREANRPKTLSAALLSLDDGLDLFAGTGE
jgi:hypothetical protein